MHARESHSPAHGGHASHSHRRSVPQQARTGRSARAERRQAERDAGKAQKHTSGTGRSVAVIAALSFVVLAIMLFGFVLVFQLRAGTGTAQVVKAPALVNPIAFDPAPSLLKVGSK